MYALYHHRTQGREVEAVHIHGLATGLEELGYEVEIIGPPGVEVNPDVVASHVSSKKGRLLRWIAERAPQTIFECLEIGYNLVAVPRLLRRYSAARPELIYERYSLYNATGAIVSRLTGVPLALEVNDTVHVDRTRQGKSVVMPGVAGWFERRILEGATSIVVVSNYLRDLLIGAGVPAEKIIVTPNAVDAGRFSPDQAASAAVRQRYGLDKMTVVGFAGSFTKWHGVEFLVRACAELMSTRRDVGVLMVGDGVRRSDSEALARELGIADRCVFTGRVPHCEMPDYMGAMDIGVMPASNPFGSPMKVFEYMAMGVPPVAPQYGPMEEAVVNGETGLLFQPDQHAGLVSCLRTLVESPERRAAMGAAAREKVLSQHQWVHNAGAVVEALQRKQQLSHPTVVAQTAHQEAQ